MADSVPRARKLVVAGLVLHADGRVLATKRRADQSMPLLWEFPGGKVEAGESPEAALRRELHEEIGVTVEVGLVWDVMFHAYPEFDVVMLVYGCRIAGNAEPRAVEVAELAWCDASALGERTFLPADEPLVARLQREGAPAWRGRSLTPRR